MKTRLAVAFGLLLAACGGAPTIDCATAKVPKYSEVTAFQNCTRCHASTLSGAQRREAPANDNFDTYEAAKRGANEAQDEVASGAMPPKGEPALSEAEKTQLYTWAQCGTPQ